MTCLVDALTKIPILTKYTDFLFDLTTKYPSSSVFSEQIHNQFDTNRIVCSRGELSEYDVLLSSGERTSCGLLAITFQSIGVNAKSWLAWQLPIMTDDFHSEPKLKTIKIDILKRSFAEGYTVVFLLRLVPENKTHDIVSGAP
ncbi:hypothetical protein X798_03598 [Onchocerca flexuosa]|uniref:Uncharacterized protein n=1 Tax=Onchocerca flexuosa TaxID=387005 RepID=A0A238BVS5_9BILA|nr:hypothetical protein X798_03598 [Onchocerca flexuosa]